MLLLDKKTKEYLKELKNKKDVNKLIKELKSEYSDVRYKATFFLGEIRDKRSILPLINVLNDNNEAVRYSAIHALGKIGKPAVNFIIYASNSKDIQIRFRSLEALGLIKDKKAITKLIKTLKDENREIRWYVLDIIKKYGQYGTVYLINALNYKDNEFRFHIISILGEIKDKRAVTPLLSFLENDDTNIRYITADALGKIGDKKAVEPLIKALNDEDVTVRFNAAEALGKIRDNKSIEPLNKALADEDRLVREYSAISIAKMSKKEIYNSLITNLNSNEINLISGTLMALGELRNNKTINLIIPYLKFENEFIRRDAAEALGKIGDDKAVESLINILNDQVWFVQIEAIKSLGEIGNKKAIKPLIGFLYEKDLDKKRESIKALGKIGNNTAIEHLVKALNDNDSVVQENTIQALGEIGDECALKPLVKCINSEYGYIRMHAVRSIEKLRTERKIGILIQALNDKAYYVRRRAILALLQKGNAQILQSFIDLLEDEDEFVQLGAAIAILKFGDKNTLESVLYTLKRIKWPIKIELEDYLKEKRDYKLINDINQSLESQYRNSLEKIEQYHFYGRGGGFVPTPKRKTKKIERTPYVHYHDTMDINREYKLKIDLLTIVLEEISDENSNVEIGNILNFRSSDRFPEVKIELITTLFDISPSNTQTMKIFKNKDSSIMFLIRPKIPSETEKTKIIIKFSYKSKYFGKIPLEVKITDNVKVLGKIKISRTALGTICMGIGISADLITLFIFVIPYVGYTIGLIQTNISIIWPLIGALIMIMFTPLISYGNYLLNIYKKKMKNLNYSIS